MRKFLLLFAWLFLLVTPLHAQDVPEWDEATMRDKAWLAVYVNPYGGAHVALEFPAAVRDREQLKRILTGSLSFPLQFHDTTEEEATIERPWTIISGTTPEVFSGGPLKSTFRVDVQSLLPHLEQHHMNSLKVIVYFQRGPGDVKVAGAQQVAVPSARDDRFEADVDVHAATAPASEFSRGYSAGDLSKRSIPLIVFLLVPALWTSLSARRRSRSGEELWGRHLRFLHRLLNVVWLAWLPMYFFSGLDEIITFLFGADRRGVGQIVNVAFYFIPPVIAMFLCHFASRRVYEQVVSVDWSPRQVVRRAIIANTLSLIPMFLVIVGMLTFVRSPRQAALYVIIGYIGFIVLSQNVGRLLGSRLHALTSGDLRNRIFDLAYGAGVKLKQVYVLPETSAQLSNAFARSDNSVLITNSLLKNLSRREVDSIMAHEIGHLQAKHPQTSGTISPPVFPEITSQPALLKFNFAFAFRAAVRLSIFAAIIAFAIRLSYISIVYMAVAAFLLTMLDELSRIVKNKDRVTPIIPKPPSFETGTYQAGSWKKA
jgi:Zn-dependent protease with chaperone function